MAVRAPYPSVIVLLLSFPKGIFCVSISSSSRRPRSPSLRSGHRTRFQRVRYLLFGGLLP